MKSGKQFVNTLEDNICERGAMNRLISDSARVEFSSKIKDILRTFIIDSGQSEPYYQHQNPDKCRFNKIKTTTNTVLDRTGAPPSTWLLCLLYVIFVLNHTFCTSINAVPMQRLKGSTPDISPLLSFRFWEEVYYRHDDSDFPSETREGHGHFVGISEHVGHAMTFKILTSDTNKVIYRSSVRSAESNHPNLRAKMGRNAASSPSNTFDNNNDSLPEDRLENFSEHGEMGSLPKKDFTPSDNPPKVVQSRHDLDDPETPPSPMPIINPTDLVGRTFLIDGQEVGQTF